MNRTMLALGVLATGLLMAGTGSVANSAVGAAPAVREGISFELGRRDFRNYCAACHGIGGKGDGTMAEFLTLKMPDLTLLSRRNMGPFPREKVIGIIDGRADVKVHGARDMPVWGDWFDSEAAAPKTDRKAREEIVRERIESLVTFLQTIQVK